MLLLADNAAEAWKIAEASGYRVERIRLVRENVTPPVPADLEASY